MSSIGMLLIFLNFCLPLFISLSTSFRRHVLSELHSCDHLPDANLTLTVIIVTLIIRHLPLTTGSSTSPSSSFCRPLPLTVSLVANASDAEKGEATPRVPKQSKSKAKKSCPLKKIFVGIFLLICLFVAMFGMGVLGAHFAAHQDSSNEALDGASHETVLAIQVASAHDERFIARRDQTADASYPISTKTALSTIYEVRHTPTLEIETVFETVTGTTVFTTITVSNLTPTIVPPELPPKSTVTSCTTFVLTLPYSKPTNIVGVPPESTVTATIYETEGDASTSTTTVFVPPPPYPPQPPYPTANDTTLPDSTGNNPIVPHMPTPTPVIISGGTKKPEPRGWGGTSGTTNLSCTVMLVAVIMFLL
ncbi:hypothetical protein HYE68_004741 [Fusarium pseudograminearum]|nr:hypothetical protein HYE68_004741 [Fusarium pseudograminearum]